ncbi:MAG: CoA-binding protein [Rhodospirillales bacterium]|nr:CoA-binding protein [Rhodospirillales bacterium]
MRARGGFRRHASGSHLRSRLRRDRAAEVSACGGEAAVKPGASIKPFFEPRSVAVIGASRSPGKAGYQQVANLARIFRGQVFPINPHATEICGVPCRRSVSEIEGPVDLAIVLLPAPHVPEAVRACVEKGVPAVLIASAGFAEIGPEGKRLQDAILDAVAGTKTRIWGPNCNGLVNTGVNLLASFVDLSGVRPGPLAIVGQTGIFAAAFLNQIMDIPELGVSKVATLGNASDVDIADVVEYLAEDSATEVIALYLEGFKNGERFIRLCRELVRRKPIVAVTAGGSEAGARASLSHTANLAADGRVTRGVFEQAGIVLVDEFSELIDVARALALWRGASSARRIAVLTTSGGAGVLAVDHIDRAGLDVATFSKETIARVSTLSPVPAGSENPLDIWPAMQAVGTNRAIGEIADAVLADPGVDASVMVFGAFSGGGSEFDPSVIRQALETSKKPAAAWLYGPRALLDPWAQLLAKQTVPVFPTIGSAVRALQAQQTVFEHRGQLAPSPHASPLAVPAASRALIAEARRRGDQALSEVESRRLLAHWGIAAPPEALVADEDEAAHAAERIGYPVAVKIVSAEIAHKSDVGGVALDLGNAAAVRAAVGRIRTAVRAAAPEAKLDGFIVQAMVRGRAEVIAGITRTPQFGPVVMCGLGGLLAEAMRQVAFRLPPLDAATVDRMIESLGVGAILGATRGRGPADLAALRHVLMTFSSLAADPDIEQIEINPLVVLDQGQGVSAVDALVVLRNAKPA